MKFDDDFREAILNLSSKEKDKLLIRLIKKDKNLTKRLFFELVDNRTMEERRDLLEEEIRVDLNHDRRSYYSPAYLIKDLRRVSSKIADHVRTTKDKFGEVSLNIIMLNTALDKHSEMIEGVTKGRSRKLCIYIVTKAFRLMVLIQKLHEDYMVEIMEDRMKLEAHFQNNSHLARIAKQNGLQPEWLMDIPENIVEIQKDIKSKGYLRAKTYLDTPDYQP